MFLLNKWTFSIDTGSFLVTTIIECIIFALCSLGGGKVGEKMCYSALFSGLVGGGGEMKNCIM